ncbi:MAG: MFS transporter [Vicinamibacterales bacterium]
MSSLAALSHRNFRLLWIGQLVSFSGSMMQNAAILWQVSLLAPPGHKGLALGMVGASRFVPIIFFSLLSGAVADAFDRRRVMLVTQSAMGLIAGALAVLTFGGLTSAWPIYVLSMIGGAASTFDGPARQSLIPALVPRHHLPSAISLNTTMFQIAAVSGPALGGLVIGLLGIGWAYAFNALSFLGVIYALISMRDVPEVPDEERSEVSLHAVVEGIRFVFSTPLIRSSMLVDFFATFFSSAMALLPIFAQDILHVGPSGYGWLVAAPAVGAVVTGITMISAVHAIERRGQTLLVAVGVYGLATVLFGLSTTFWMTFCCLAVTGVADTVSMVLRNLIRQLGTPDSMRGRMIGVNMVFFMGGPQLGELEAGLVANAFGAPFSVISGGVGCLLATLVLAWSTPELRAYRREESLRRVATA